eukprot:CAMPEP_0204842000 /NCGR_PEP_ID=MMETSP1346-20131115/44350_1 /ASSEMBLY_ACC=CAM_ASM_000771 /TAXON_ID=215587 /ORGANISM="Aplanochytrium stocchinoi, Strain GSBS06" /LENGTH=455 /DNA_ID=CAMNT_0051980515 /DNA_START=95 /DNA_END=1462 /DNA_ORIENTATION=-
MKSILSHTVTNMRRAQLLCLFTGNHSQRVKVKAGATRNLYGIYHRGCNPTQMKSMSGSPSHVVAALPPIRKCPPFIRWLMSKSSQGLNENVQVEKINTSSTDTDEAKGAEILGTITGKERKTSNVRAYYIAKKIHTVAMFQKVYGKHKHWLELDCVIVEFPDKGTNGYTQTESYAVFFDYGAAVFFNCDMVVQRESIAYAKKFCDGYIRSSGVGGDDYTVNVVPELQAWSQFRPNGLDVQELDISNIRVISSVLGQTVALSHFEQLVDGMLKTFEKANSNEDSSYRRSFFSRLTDKMWDSNPNSDTDSNSNSSSVLFNPNLNLQNYSPPVQKSGFSLLGGGRRERKELFRMLGECNDILAHVIGKLGLLDRTRMRDTAWKYAKYYTIWEGLRDEFEVTTRWEIMNTKTEYLQQNMRFFVEVLHSKKSERLEWIIIYLITGELLISIYNAVLIGAH